MVIERNLCYQKHISAPKRFISRDSLNDCRYGSGIDTVHLELVRLRVEHRSRAPYVQIVKSYDPE